MDMDEYQRLANATDQFPDENENENALAIPLFGIVGELGSLITVFKKKIRDGDSYTNYMINLREEMGDVLWYISNLATKIGFSLSEIAEENIAKTTDRWPTSDRAKKEYVLYDEKYPEEEKIPRQLSFQLSESSVNNKAQVCLIRNGAQVGDPLTDNAYSDDGYRYHDVFHLAYAAVLGWSPVLRHLMKIKRKSSSTVDEVEDGARARIIEEAISLYIFTYAKNHHLLKDVNEIDQEVLSTAKQMVSGLEVANRTSYDWKTAIFLGYEIFRKANDNNGGTIHLDLYARSVKYEEPEK